MAIGTPTSIGSATDAANDTTVALTLTANVSIGDKVIVVVGGLASRTVAITDSGGNTWVQDVTSNTNWRLSTFSSEITTALTSGTSTITATFSGLSFSKALAAFKVTGLLTSGHFDKGVSASGTTTGWDSGNTAALAQADNLLVGASVSDSTSVETNTAGAGYTELFDITNGSAFQLTVEFKTVSSTAADNADGVWTNSGSRTWEAQIAVYKGAGGGSSPQTVSVTGLGSAKAFGTVSIAVGGVTRSITGISSVAAFGSVSTLKGGVSRTMVGLGSAAAFGSVSASSGGINVPVSGLGSAAQFGSPTILKGGVAVPVSGLGSAAAFGTPSAGGGTLVAVTGLGSAAAFGTPTIIAGGTTRTMVGLGSAAQFGSVTTTGGASPTFSPAIHGGKHR